VWLVLLVTVIVVVVEVVELWSLWWLRWGVNVRAWESCTPGIQMPLKPQLWQKTTIWMPQRLVVVWSQRGRSFRRSSALLLSSRLPLHGLDDGRQARWRRGSGRLTLATMEG